jgi:hypothetical protein
MDLSYHAEQFFWWVPWITTSRAGLLLAIEPGVLSGTADYQRMELLDGPNDDTV